MKAVTTKQNKEGRKKAAVFSETGEEGTRPVRWRPALRKTGLILTAVSGALLTSTLSLPWYVPALATAAGLAGSILTILTQPDPPAEESRADGTPTTG